MKITLLFTILAFVLSLVLFESLAFAFEDTRVMPKGIRRVEYINVNAALSKKTDAKGDIQDLANPLRADLKVSNMVKKRSGFEKTQLQGFLQTQGLSESDSLGQFTADLKGHINVQALSVAYGLTDRLTLGFGLPYYTARTSARVGFKQNEKAEGVVQALYDQGNIGKSREAAQQLNAAASSFNDTLLANGYEPIGDWQDQGLGDVILKAKYFVGDFKWTRMALQAGLTLPTGQVDDPNILTDVAFGDGTFDQSVGVIFDQPMLKHFIFNQYANYTHQSAARREVRLVTDEEPIEGDLKDVSYKLGDKYELGTSCRLVDDESGVSTGLGYQYHKKLGDSYSLADAGAATEKLDRDTHQTSHIGEFSIGYSSISAFRRGEIPVPFSANFVLQRQLESVNTPVADRVQLDAKIFF